jgi:Cu+-exporting ATPase
LTQGQPQVLALHPADNALPAKELLRLAASIQQGSAHPLAQAMVRKAEDEGLSLVTPERLTDLPGRGLEAAVAGRRLVIGSRRLMGERGIDMTACLDQAEAAESAGRTAAWLAEGPSLRGMIVLGDTLRVTAKPAIERLHGLGVTTVLLTGDNARAGAAVAEQLGLDRVLAEVLPEDKAAEIERLRGAGETVAMVGDGVNDAPALAAADLGIAMGEGSDVALETAPVVLMRGDPLLVADAVAIARATHRKIAQNLFWAFFYNVLGIPLAAFGLLSPVFAGAAMALSSVSVVGNALLLHKQVPPPSQPSEKGPDSR